MHHVRVAVPLIFAAALACASSSPRGAESDAIQRNAERACLKLVAGRGETATVKDSQVVGRRVQVTVDVTTAFGGQRVQQCQFDVAEGKASVAP